MFVVLAITGLLLAALLATSFVVIASNRKLKAWHSNTAKLLSEFSREDQQPVRRTKIGLGPLGTN